MKNVTRRRLLRLGVGTTLATVGTAGCLSDSSGSGTPEEPTTDEITASASQTDSTETEQSTKTASASTDIRAWVPMPGATPTTRSSFTVMFADLDSLRRLEDSFWEDGYGALRNSTLGPAAALPLDGSIRQSVTFGGSDTVTLARTRLGPDELATTLTDAGLSDTDVLADVPVYDGTVEGQDVTAAVVGDALVVLGDVSSKLAYVQAVLDARAGDGDSYLTTDEDIVALDEALPDGQFGFLSSDDQDDGPTPIGGSRGIGYAWSFGESRTDLHVGIAYPEGDAPAPTELTDFISGRAGFADYDGFEASATGRVVVSTGSIETENFDLLTNGDPGNHPTSYEVPPQVNFGFEQDQRAETVTIQHHGGDTLTASELNVSVAGEPTDTQWADEFTEVQAGDSLTVSVAGAESGDELKVEWLGENNSAIIALYRVE
ncbi:hypothetical protein [Haloarchaeobius sp. DFWS5]|uniref:hypothetical protein n=1 Tax=Haloarchaeobius sp. DFWS5 TaxID=3446114 RepID=UPI003EBB489F